jgi:hypothetical protein
MTIMLRKVEVIMPRHVSDLEIDEFWSFVGAENRRPSPSPCRCGARGRFSTRSCSSPWSSAYTTILNIYKSPKDIKIASLFIGAISSKPVESKEKLVGAAAADLIPALKEQGRHPKEAGALCLRRLPEANPILTLCKRGRSADSRCLNSFPYRQMA